MQDNAQKIVQSLPAPAHLAAFAKRLLQWLLEDLGRDSQESVQFGASRAKALLRAADLLDDPTRHSFQRLMENETAVRLALYDLLQGSDLGNHDEVAALGATTAASNLDESADSLTAVAWEPLAITAYAWKNGYPIHQLDPASPPSAYSPAGQVLKRAAYFMRQQVQRSATERDKLGRKVVHVPSAATAASLGTATSNSDTLQPVLPYYRPPVPVNYPEVVAETVQIDMETVAEPAQEPQAPPPPPPAPTPTPTPEPPVVRNAPITITEGDVAALEAQPTRMPSLRITADQIPAERPSSPPPRRQQPTPARRTSSRRRKKEGLKSTKLRVLVQEYPDGPGLYGLQVHVNAQGMRTSVSGTTNRDGKFLCELPVYAQSGLTYDIDIVWPREMGGSNERKSITLHADRTLFVVPFYQRLHS
ncbi:MAG: hypothetical protein AAF614_10590 [Chloroflexota bacterium]